MMASFIVGFDLAKNVIQIHAVDRAGRTIHNRKLSRNQVIRYFAELPSCTIGAEACASAHYGAREIQKLGHLRTLLVHSARAFYARAKMSRDPRAAWVLHLAETRGPSIAIVALAAKMRESSGRCSVIVASLIRNVPRLRPRNKALIREKAHGCLTTYITRCREASIRLDIRKRVAGMVYRSSCWCRASALMSCETLSANLHSRPRSRSPARGRHLNL